MVEEEYPKFEYFYRLNVMEEIDAQEGTGEMYDDMENATQGQYFAPVQDVDANFGSVSSTDGCSNRVSHDLRGVREGTKIYAAMDGVVEFKQTYCDDELVSFGNRVQITADDGTYIIYAHLKDFPDDVVPKVTKTCPKKGAGVPPCPESSLSCDVTTTVLKKRNVKKGEYIGTVGNTGNSTAAHLHVEIHNNGKQCVTDPWAAFGMR